ncbi:hypothetical protein [Staphylococcus argensis]|uniref:hypothetical protein n=1 Tax=Staphylococcus argensis TaxID=1607738 RepID=UPI0022848EEA|nr:hypothetical protein [Staphylococcus argensis]MCY6990769.1 hypothetical protein [Staphylococcus argensis]
MNKDLFQQKVTKHLWFLNKKEKKQLQQTIQQMDPEQEQDAQLLQRPIFFANQFLKAHIFRQKVVSTTTFMLLLLGLLVSYVITVGLFLFGFITSLSAVNYFIHPQGNLTLLSAILILIGAVGLVIIALWLIKQTTAFFTKKLLEYKYNRSR